MNREDLYDRIDADDSLSDAEKREIYNAEIDEEDEYRNRKISKSSVTGVDTVN